MKKKTENMEETIEGHKEEIRRLSQRIANLADQHHELNVRFDKLVTRVGADFKRLIEVVGR